jgi:hypothetical protein
VSRHDLSLTANMKAIVVAYSSIAYMDRCPTALSESLADKIVVDKASSDGIRELVRRSFSAVLTNGREPVRSL